MHVMHIHTPDKNLVRINITKDQGFGYTAKTLPRGFQISVQTDFSVQAEFLPKKKSPLFCQGPFEETDFLKQGLLP